ncbi:MAG: ATP-binding protein [Candidatus Methanogaster sp.]|uniref:ATP-binding protein n=1 Tax=Candidatus Methanogaster sp. TaxID=3386292 RepID=A0AC61L2N9_9EURY|nr:MAG: ATP-binding protein [ANME-2 cluster archaeon]
MEVTFHNRELEMKEIRDILGMKPRLITFIYGPINSGKTELINQLVEQLPEDYKVFYINLRGRFVSNYDDFIKVLFDVEHEARYERIKEFLGPIVNVLPESYYGIPIPKDMFLKLFREKEVEDAFVYIETVLRAFYESGRAPVLVIDELQVIGDLKIDGLLIYKLFNFFVRLTKELHLAHVFVVTSDSLFLEQVYSEAMLEGRSDYLLVDDFDYETTSVFLDKYGLNDTEKERALEYCGGKPVYLVKLVNTKISGGNIAAKSERMLEEEISKLIFMLARNKEVKSDIVELLSIFASVEKVKYSDNMDLDLLSFLVRQNILFIDPVERTIKPQSRLNLLAIREVLKNA